MKYVIETSVNFPLVGLFREINGVFTPESVLQVAYPIDRIVADKILENLNGLSPFLQTADRSFFKVEDDFGELVLLILKIYNSCETFEKKLLFIERVQLFTNLKTKNYHTLVENMQVYYMSEKISK